MDTSSSVEERWRKHLAVLAEPQSPEESLRRFRRRLSIWSPAWRPKGYVWREGRYEVVDVLPVQEG